MNKTVGAVIIMAIAAFIGLFLGAYLDNTIGGMLLLAFIAGIACVVYTIEKTSKGE